MWGISAFWPCTCGRLGALRDTCAPEEIHQKNQTPLRDWCRNDQTVCSWCIGDLQVQFSTVLKAAFGCRGAEVLCLCPVGSARPNNSRTRSVRRRSGARHVGIAYIQLGKLNSAACPCHRRIEHFRGLTPTALTAANRGPAVRTVNADTRFQ